MNHARQLSKVSICKVAISFTLLILAVLLTIYIFPYKIDIEALAISEYDEDDIVNVSISITKERHLFKPTQITGHILFDGVDYESMSTMGYDIYDSKNIWENMQLKFQDFSYNLFVRSDLKDQQIDLLKDTLNITNLSETDISIYKVDEFRNGGVSYNLVFLP